MICSFSCCLFVFRGREFRPAADLLSFASPKESKQRKGDPTVCDPCASLRGNLRCSRFAGSRRTRFAQTAASPDPRNAALLGAARGEGESRAFASLGLGTANSQHKYQPPQARSACGGFVAERSDGPPGTQTPSVCAEERSVSRIRARPCLSEASLGETPRNVSTAGCPKRSVGTQTAGSPFFCLRFFGEAKKSRSPAGARPGLRPSLGAQR